MQHKSQPSLLINACLLRLRVAASAEQCRTGKRACFIRHQEERFQKILQNMEAKYQAEHERVRKWLEEQGDL